MTFTLSKIGALDRLILVLFGILVAVVIVGALALAFAVVVSSGSGSESGLLEEGYNNALAA